MKKYLIMITAAVMILMLAACGGTSDKPAGETPEGKGTEQEEAAEESVHPYAWLGLEDMPECDYLDALASNKYYKESDNYIKDMSYVSKEINARDGINSYKKNENSLVYSVDGKTYSINENSKSYMEKDMSDMAEDLQEQYDSAMENGTNIYGRKAHGTGSEAVPIYSKEKGDDAEYEYYEYNYPENEEDDNSTIERFYLKDGDVFAIYTKNTMGDTVVEFTEIIKKMTTEIPDGIFDVPDLSGYEKMDI